MIDFQQMSNIKKVAALLIVLGPNTASEILKNISDDDIIEQITIEIANLNKVPPEVLDEVLEEESREYRSLLGLSTEKTPVIVSGDLEKLAKITDEEQTGDSVVVDVVDPVWTSTEEGNNTYKRFSKRLSIKLILHNPLVLLYIELLFH